MSQSTRPTYPQLKISANFLEENPGIAKGYLRSAQAKWETKQKWEQITITLNAMGGTQKYVKGRTKDQPLNNEPTSPSVIVEQQEDAINLPLSGSPEYTPLLASTQSSPRRSPRIPARLSRPSVRPTIDKGRRSQIQVERDCLVSIEERQVEAELIQARALQENMAGLAIM